MKARNYFLTTVISSLLICLLLAYITIVVDPYFHYRAPKGVYKLDSERYQNDGIAKHFSYDAIITGSSMTENFKTSELDELFDVNSVKLSFAGARFKEIDSITRTAAEANQDIKIVVRSLDLAFLTMDKDEEGYTGLPTYLYDKNVFNDVSYFFNKEVLLKDTLRTIEMNLNGERSTTFDEYAFWYDEKDFGWEKIKANRERPVRSEEMADFPEEADKRARDNIKQNVVETALAYPDITFYLFFPPYSCMWWESITCAGHLDYNIGAQKCAIEELLKCENVKLFSFCDQYDITCDMDNYKDAVHYGADINSRILQSMRAGECQLTEENYEEYIENLRNYYFEMDYDQYYE